MNIKLSIIHPEYTLFLEAIEIAEIGKKLKQKLNNTLRLNFDFLKIIRFIHPRYHPKIIGEILKNVQKTSASALMKLYD